ncbi:MAG: aminoacyl-histidine dipeptidase [Sphaerochaetaceae bacterium]
MSSLESLKKDNLWKYFLEISAIPRESGNEAQIREYLINYALKHNLEHFVDQSGNVIIRAKATKGFEKVPSIALQGHMDMVCVKDEGIIHDFTKDPIPVKRDGDFLCGEGTSLGGDNGVALALILDLFSDKEAQHGPLEAIITVEEETGLTGAFGLDASLIQSRQLINLDSEEEGVFYIGCAGGIEVNARLPIEKSPVSANSILLDISVENLLGGHSGSEINQQRANAISVMSRLLLKFNAHSPVQLLFIEGGTKRNVIPSLCQATIALPRTSQEEFEKIKNLLLKDLQQEYAKGDPDLTINCRRRAAEGAVAATAQQSEAFIKSLYLAPHGVERMSETIEGMVETSSNLALVRTTEEAFTVVSSHRSSLQSARDNIALKMRVALETSGAKATFEGSYPAWTPRPDSPLAASAAKAWESFSGEKAKITAIHAGLECGIINSLVEGMDSISLGPVLLDVHSTKERLSIASTEKIARFLRHLLLSLT